MRNFIHFITFVAGPRNGFFTNFAIADSAKLEPHILQEFLLNILRNISIIPIRIMNIDLIDPIELY